MASPYGMAGVGDALGGLGDTLTQQVKTETEEQRKKRLAAMTRPVSDLFGTQSNLGVGGAVSQGLARGTVVGR